MGLATMKRRGSDNMRDQVTLDCFADVVASALLDHVLWRHLTQENHDGK